MARNKDDSGQALLDSVAREWLAARDVIADFLAEIRPDHEVQTHRYNAAAILARLAAHDPPIVTGFTAEGEQ